MLTRTRLILSIRRSVFAPLVVWLVLPVEAQVATDAALLSGVTMVAMTTDAAGNVYLAGYTNLFGEFPATATIGQRGGLDAFVAKLDPTLSQLLYAVEIGGSDYDAALAIAVDDTGRVFIAGSTGSVDFPTTPGAFQVSTPVVSTSFVLALDGTGSELAYSTYFPASEITAIALDRQGRVHLTGAAFGGLPVTEGAVQSEFSPATCLVSRTGTPFSCPDAFASRLSAADALEYSTFLGGGADVGSPIDYPPSGSDRGLAIAVDERGDIYVAGLTTSPDFPVTEGAVQRELDRTSGFVAKIDPAGRLVYSTLFGDDENNVVSDLAVLPSSEVWALVNSNELSGVSSVSGVGLGVTRGSFLARLSLDGNELLDTRQLGAVNGFEAAADGSLTLVASEPPGGGDLSYCLNTSFVAQLDPENREPERWVAVPGVCTLFAEARVAVAANGALFVAGAVPTGFNGALSQAQQHAFGSSDFGIGIARLDLSAGTTRFAACIENAASREINEDNLGRLLVAPGEVVTITGRGLGPEAGVAPGLDNDSRLPTEAAGTRVWFGDLPAPLHWVADGQINAIVPFGVSGPTVPLVIEQDGERFGHHLLGIADAMPGVFTENFSGTGQIVATNEDGSLNASFNPALRGSTATFFATGVGALSPSPIDGETTPSESGARGIPTEPIRVTIGDRPAELAEAVSAPGLVAGVLRLHVRVPADLPPDTGHWVYVYAGEARSQSFATIAVK
jgi:uncharacterized protein (TIGR03437 family)